MQSRNLNEKIGRIYRIHNSLLLPRGWPQKTLERSTKVQCGCQAHYSYFEQKHNNEKVTHRSFLKIAKKGTFLGYAFVRGTNPKHEEGHNGVRHKIGVATGEFVSAVWRAEA